MYYDLEIENYKYILIEDCKLIYFSDYIVIRSFKKIDENKTISHWCI